MKGIILAGGKGTRLAPLTIATSKQLLPIFDKPMIYYPLSILMLAGIKEVLIISTERDTKAYQYLLGNGSEIGMSFSYAIQEKPRGLADAFIVGEKFIGQDNVWLILGDNFFYGNNLSKQLQTSCKLQKGAEIFGYQVSNPTSFGVAVLDGDKVIEVEEKPKNPKSDIAITGLYFFDNNVIKFAKNVKPSDRGEIEITSIIEEYVKQGLCKLNKFSRGIAWLDTGTQKSMLQASLFVQTLQETTSEYIACIEEIAFRMGFINKEQLLFAAEKQKNSDYGKYIKKLVKENDEK